MLIHGCFCLDYDPDIIKSADIILKALMAELYINKFDDWKLTIGDWINFLKVVNLLMNGSVTMNREKIVMYLSYD